jgi:hypothetical protein
MFRPMTIHHQEVSCMTQALWYSSMSKYMWYGAWGSVVIKALRY